MSDKFRQHSSHWGTFTARKTKGGLEIKPFEGDPDPSPILGNIPASLDHPARLRRPLVRAGWLADGPGADTRRGSDSYVEMDWDAALDLVADELKRHGAGAGAAENQAGAKVFGGSYGWSSAGRFHHAQSQVHRFLNCAFGGYVRSVNSYSSAAGAVILSYVLGDAAILTRDHPHWEELADQTEFVLAFGGLPLRNTQVSNGGNTVHVAAGALAQAAERGCRFASITPLRDDFGDNLRADWIAPRPGTDVALMLAIAWHVATTGRVDHQYLERYTDGYALFEPYLLGKSDGIPKTPAWAASITGVPVEKITELAELASTLKTLINVTYSLQRAVNGEQPVWMALVLSAMLGQTGVPGAGFSYGLGSMGNIGKATLGIPLPSLPQGRNGVSDFIPVSRISDLLLNPKTTYTYKGETREYPEIKLVYWAGGNPFHHHQDLNRLRSAFAKPETIIVHETAATATARHADIILPATITAEREDIGASGNDPFLYAMERLSDPIGEARDDYEIFSALSKRLSCDDAFTEGRNVREWLTVLYDKARAALASKGTETPDFETFWDAKVFAIPRREQPGQIARFYADPEGAPLPTETGRIIIASKTIARDGGTDYAPHPAWRGAGEWLGAPEAKRYPLQLIANQPATRLHSQIDYGAYSQSQKVSGREKIRMHPDDAAARGIRDRDVVKVTSARGAVFAGVSLTDACRRSVVQLATGAWFDPAPDGNGEASVCLHGNPNVLTMDVPASVLSQGCAGQLCLVEIERVIDAPPLPMPFRPIVPNA